MKYRKMGSLDWQVSALGFGCMRLPMTKKLMVPRVDLDESIRIIRHGIDLGINYIDTAWPYHFGASEKIVGQALRDGYRERVHLVTKLPMFVVRKADQFDRFLNQQLEKLQTDFLDIYLFHSLSKGQFEKLKRLNLMDKMQRAKDKGLIKHIGFSFHDTLPVFKEIIDYADWDVAQIQYNYMDTGIQATTEGLKYAHEKGIAVVAMEPVKGGKLANPPAEAIEIMNVAENRRSLVEWALQFLWNCPEVSVVLSGMGSRKMVDENCSSADRSGINSLGPEDTQIISRLAEVYRDKILVPCTSCRYCMPCPSGVNIPQNFAILNSVSLGDRKWSVRREYKKLASSEKRLDRQHPNGNASMCSECGECLEKCPQQIDIPGEMKKVQAIVGEHRAIADYYG